MWPDHARAILTIGGSGALGWDSFGGVLGVLLGCYWGVLGVLPTRPVRLTGRAECENFSDFSWRGMLGEGLLGMTGARYEL